MHQLDLPHTTYTYDLADWLGPQETQREVVPQLQMRAQNPSSLFYSPFLLQVQWNHRYPRPLLLLLQQHWLRF